MSLLSLPLLDRVPSTARFGHVLTRTDVSTLQINIGRLCNIACNHCHIESSPARTDPHDNMDESTARKVVEWALRHDTISTIDFTGGSPEMNPNYRWMVEMFAQAGRHVMTRCNPTLIEYVGPTDDEDYAWIPKFYARHAVEVIASMPCYLEKNVDRQRGRGAYQASIDGLLALNAVGYGRDARLRLNLVYNPVGPSLPPAQKSLEGDYKTELKRRFGIEFDELWTITNMPISRWRHELERDGRLEAYMEQLIDAFNVATLPGLMCRHQINVGPDGRVYDCDFNLALDLRSPGMEGSFLWETDLDNWLDRSIGTGDHCYGCTAGAGSSCGGALL